MPDLSPNPADAPQDQRNDQRPTGEAQPDWVRQSGKSDRHCAQGNAEKDADEEWNEMGFVQFLERIANYGCRFVEIFFATDDLQLITELQTQTRYSRHLEIGAGNASDSDSKTIIKIQFADSLAQYVAIGHNYTAESNIAFG